MKEVVAQLEDMVIPTYGVGVPEKNPIFFEKRVYQGSCGKVYPTPFIDKVYDEPKPKTYQAARLENDFVRLVMLPEIGGRIFLGQDKVNNDYDFFYRQDVIKPALVGLAGPWISGGVEFNWPQHHRPGTFMPSDVSIEDEGDGIHTVWMSEHDPLNRLKGLHGVRLRPDSALVELRARLFNRTPYTQTFLWWANVAAMVHDNYQSFFPPDVHYVADHAVRAMSSFPEAMNDYYGVDYAAREGANDLSWYRNIPVPTSYMVCDTDFAFFGGYDFDADGGFIHVANKHVSPGKKQWTWGNHEFGWAWDRELTDENGPYVELMAGVYTDNQPDFTYLMPYETKTFSQFWWPYKKIGPVQNATEEAAIRLVVNDDRSMELGVVVSSPVENARIVLLDGENVLLDERATVTPDLPWQKLDLKFEGDREQTLKLVVEDAEGSVLVAYRPVETENLERKREVATEPPAPEEIETIEELYFTAEHLEQYRHPTRYPELYWDEALKRDPNDVRINIAYGRRHLYKGELEQAAERFQIAIKRLTHRHPNPVSGEAHYYLGLVRRFQNRLTEAYKLLYKSTWNYEWRAAAYYELATIDCRRQDWKQALEHIEASLDTNRRNLKAETLKALVLGRMGRSDAAKEQLEELVADDALNHWAQAALANCEENDFAIFLEKSRNDAQTILDVAFDYAEAGFCAEAIALIELHHANEVTEIAVPNPLERSTMTHFVLAKLQACAGQDPAETLAKANALDVDYLFPSRLQEQLVLEWAMEQTDAPNAAYGLGNYLFDRKRHSEAIVAWEKARESKADLSTVHRNLGIAYWNVRRDGAAARDAYVKAREANPADARLLFEFDQLRKKLNEDPQDRLAELEANMNLVQDRDDCSVELAALYNLTGKPEKALDLLETRRFHPWEGGEGQVLRQYTTARLMLGQAALESDAAAALAHFEKAMDTPDNLGEKYHLLQAKADVNYWTGLALRKLGREEEAVEKFESSASEAGDFQAMAVTAHSELSYYRGLSLQALGREQDAQALFADFKSFAETELKTAAKIDYFATSLPLLLVFEDDLDAAKQCEGRYLLALAEQGLGNETAAQALFNEVLEVNPAHPGACAMSV